MLFYQLGARSMLGWSYSNFVSVCLFVCPSVHGLRRPRNELIAAADMYGCFKLGGLFASSLQRKTSDASSIDSRGIRSSRHKRDIVKAAPETWEWQETSG